MPQPRVSKERCKQIIDAINDALRKGYRPPGENGHGPAAMAVAADALGMNHKSMRTLYESAWRYYQMAPDWTLWKRQRERAIPPMPKPSAPLAEAAPIPEIEPEEFEESDLMAALRKHPMTLADIAERFQISKGQALDTLETLQRAGANIHQIGDQWAVGKSHAPAFTRGDLPTFTSAPDNTFRFGVMADSHLGSKYERLDALNDSYDKFAAEGIERVYHCGNWIEGEARFNRTDLAVHGMDAQLAYLAKKYPQRPGITTYAIWGDDHEGWTAQREGIDIGVRAEQTMREHGRSDWVNIGFMEAHVRLVNANTGKSSILAAVHPGGGSSYAESYAVQKVIESLDGGEKPAVALYGHWHKCLAGNYRNVWWVLVPSTKDQDVFMRKKRIRSVVGGGIIRLVQDPDTGAIVRCSPDLWQYFNLGYYNNRWSHSGGVTLPDRTIAGITPHPSRSIGGD